MIETEERVNNLESLTEQTQIMIQSLSYEVSRTQIQIDKVSRNVDKLTQEMKEFKNEIRQDMKDFKANTETTTENLSQNIYKLGESMNKKWEELVKKLGTLVEDMVIPNIEFIAEKYFNLKNGRIYTRTKIYNPEDNSNQREFDVIAMYPDKIILVEAKSNPKPEEAKEFIDFVKGREFFVYFPEYAGKVLIPVFASFHIPENVLKKLSKNKIYAMGIKEDTMDILNQELLKPL